MTCSITELRARGITFEATEAVAITQQLISGLVTHPAHHAEPPYGPPSPDNVYLCEDGAVVCRGCSATPAVSEVGIFLETLLMAGSPRVPGALRYTIARAQLNVDVPPFDSLAHLSRDLERHEQGARDEVVRRVLARANGERRTALALVERRRARGSASELRRALREADARWYEHQPAPAPPAVIELHPPVLRPRDRSATAAAACLAAGVALICAGEYVHRRELVPVTPTAPIAAQTAPIVERTAPVAAAPLSSPRLEAGGPERGIIAVRDVRSGPAIARRDAHRVVKRVAARPSKTVIRPQAVPREADPKGNPRRSVLDRLRLGWLRTAFIVHSDL